MDQSRGNKPDPGWLMTLFVGLWPVCFLFYWWLVAKVQLQQMVAAVVVGSVTALVLAALHYRTALRFKVKPAWLGLLLWRLPGKVLRDLALLAAELWRALSRGRHPTGAIQRVPFSPGNDDPESVARRALVTAGISLPPNAIVLAVEREQGFVLVHELVRRAETPTDKEWPV